MRVEKEYIEHNIDLIDSDLTAFFYNLYNTGAIISTSKDLIIDILEEAHIPTEAPRLAALKDVILDELHYYRHKVVLDVSLLSWVKTMLGWKFGFNPTFIVNYIVQCKSIFSLSKIYFFQNPEGEWSISVK